MKKGLDYKSSGVNIELGNDVSKVLYEAAKLTWENRRGRLGEVLELFEDFSGVRAVYAGNLPGDAYIGIGFDGVGTKIELAERIAKHDTVAYDLFAMVCDDAVRYGAEPVLVGSILDVRSLWENNQFHIDFLKQLATGYVNAAKEAGVVVINGEVAELGARVQGYIEPYNFFNRLVHAFNYLLKKEYPPVKGFHYNWGAGVLWFARKSKMLTGHKIKKGDYLVGLKEDGFRSNGLSLARKVLRTIHNDKWHEEMCYGKSFAELVLYPSKIYTKAIVEMFGGFESEPKTELHGIAHITGGGIPEKLQRLLEPSGLGADITDPFEPCGLMLYCQDIGRIADREAYSTWNMGQGMIIATPEPNDVIKIAQAHSIEAKVIGEVSSQTGIRIKNKGVDSAKQNTLSFS